MMSRESARALLKKMKGDQDFASKLLNSKSDEERMNVVRSSGFNFNSEEMRQVQEELSDEELDQLFGGNAIAGCFIIK